MAQGVTAMKTCLYKLEFHGCVRFGKDRGAVGLSTSDYVMKSDAFFSALAIEWLRVHGEAGLQELVRSAREGRFLVSDLLPYDGETLLVPKPACWFERPRKRDEEPVGDRKRLKNIRHIPVTALRDYLRHLKTGSSLPELPDEALAREELFWKNTLRTDKGAEPYGVSGWRFKEGAGLYLLVQSSDEMTASFRLVLESLGETGIGGKRSIGFGRFALAEDPIDLYEDGNGVYESDSLLGQMNPRAEGLQLLISTLIPSREELTELKKGWYTLTRRSGFVTSPDYNPAPLKRRQIVAVNAGACLSARLEGRVVDLGDGKGHPVYRMGKGFYLGVAMDE